MKWLPSYGLPRAGYTQKRQHPENAGYHSVALAESFAFSVVRSSSGPTPNRDTGSPPRRDEGRADNLFATASCVKNFAWTYGRTDFNFAGQALGVGLSTPGAGRIGGDMSTKLGKRRFERNRNYWRSGNGKESKATTPQLRSLSLQR